MLPITPSKTSVLYPVAAALVIVFSMVGIAAFTGLIPGSVAQEDAYDFAAHHWTPPPPPPPWDACVRCGVVEQIRVVEVPRQTSGLGAVAGGVVGALLGNSIGHGNGRAVGTIAGAAGGAYAGNTIEKNSNRELRFHVTVRMQDGRARMVTESSRPAYAVGEQVRVSDSGALIPVLHEHG